MAHPVVHFEINVKHPAQTNDFYKKPFEWHVGASNPMNYGVVDTHTEGHGIGGGLNPNAEGGGTGIYVEVDALEAFLKKAEALGGKRLVPVTEIPGMATFAQFTDPEGDPVRLVKSEE